MEELTLAMMLEEAYRSPTYQGLNDEDKQVVIEMVTNAHKILSKHFNKMFNLQNISTSMIELLKQYLEGDLVKIAKLAKNLPDSSFGSLSEEIIVKLLKKAFTETIKIFEEMTSMVDPEDEEDDDEECKALKTIEFIQAFQLKGETLRLFNENKLTLGDYYRLNMSSVLPAGIGL